MNMIVFISTFTIICGISLFFLRDMRSMTKKHNKKMEDFNIDHIGTLKQLATMTPQFAPDMNIRVRFLVPHQKQTLWIKLFNNIKVQLYTSDYRLDDKDFKQNSYNSIVMPKKTYFYLKMKNWVDTDNRALALKGLTHLNWKKQLP